jgi:uroporphyrinogen decarboxylase
MILCDWNMLQAKTVTDRAFIREVCDLGVRLSSAFFTALIEQDVVDGICISDGAATLIPLDLYQDIVLPAQRKLFSRFQGSGTGRFFHQCGNIQAQLALYPDAGSDCITLDAVVKIGEAYKLYHDRVVTAGNVDVIKTVLGGDHAAICKAASDCIAEISDPFRKFILMPSCDVPPETPIHNVKAFLSCADLGPE